jgi:hypothetical protein
MYPAPARRKAQSRGVANLCLHLILARIAAEVGFRRRRPGISRAAILTRRPAAGARLRLAALEVFAQSRRQPHAAGGLFLRFAVLDHGRFKARAFGHRNGRRYAAARLRCTPRLWQGSPAFRIGIIAFQQALSCRSSVVEHSLGKGEVVSSILPGSTIPEPASSGVGAYPPAS